MCFYNKISVRSWLKLSCQESVMVLVFLDPTPDCVGAVNEQKESVSNILYYVNIRFIANVQSYPNTIVNNCFQDTLQQQYRYLYKTLYKTFCTSYWQDVFLWIVTHGPGLLPLLWEKQQKKAKSLVARKQQQQTELSVEMSSSYYGQALLSCHRFQTGWHLSKRTDQGTGRRR